MAVRKTRFTKTASDLMRHAEKRLAERYGMAADALVKIVAAIQEGNSIPIGRNSLNRKHHLVEIDGRFILAVYDKKRKCIATVLTLTNELPCP